MANYHYQLKQLGIPLKQFSREAVNSISLWNVTGEGVLLGFGWPLHIVGLLFNYLPYRFAYQTADKKVKQRHFHASVNFALGMFGWLFYYLFQLIIVALLSKSIFVTLMFAAIIPLSGWFSLHFYSFLKKAKGRSQVISLLYHNREKARQLLCEREEVIAYLQEVMENLPLELIVTNLAQKTTTKGVI
jgi:hypothetical protein